MRSHENDELYYMKKNVLIFVVIGLKVA